MEHLVKIMTHETIVHGQIATIEKLLDRKIDFSLTLNIKGIRSHLEFNASPEEMELVRRNLGCKIYIHDEQDWRLLS